MAAGASRSRASSRRGGGGDTDGGRLDGTVPDGGGGGDAGMGACEGAADGTPCGDGQICVTEHCTASICGDGIADTRTEECDDGNAVAFDGCESDCQFTCDNDALCDDALTCNGAETCDTATTHMCQPGSQATDGTTCNESGVTDGVCRSGLCVTAGCGNGILETGEVCDDGNTTPDDGCENDCTYTCTQDLDCSDGNPCNGDETCDMATPTAPVCAAGTPFVCTPSDACHTSTCDPAAIDPAMPCVEAQIDADADGESPDTLGACGTDCNDSNPAVNSMAVEICGNGIDDDCNPATLDSATTTYYVDCDMDGYATNDTGALTVCEMPTTRPCPGNTGGWTTRLPSGAMNIDCDNFNANVRPNQTLYFTTNYTPSGGGGASFDYNCNMSIEQQYATTSGSSCELRVRPCPRPPCLPDLYCAGTSGWSGTTPACGASSTYRTCTGPSACTWNGRTQAGCELVCDPRSADCCVPGTTGCNVMGTIRDTYCTPGARTCPITCTPNTRNCTWQFIGCAFVNSTRTQACR